MKTILAIDQSTSATKALLFDTQGNLLDKTSLDHQQYYPQPGWVEHDAEEIYRNTLSAIRTLLDKNSDQKDNLLCLSITNQRETIVIFDKETGQPLHRAIVWQCRRGNPICEALEAEGHGEMVQQRTGLKIDTYFPASKLTWLIDNVPEVKTELAAGRALIGTIDAYLIYRLTGGRAFVTDHTNASRTLLYDINALRWDEDLCGLFGVPVEALPQVVESSAVIDHTDIDGALATAIPICGVMGDSQGALFAERCFETGSAKVTLGTGSSVLLNIGDAMALSPNGIVTTIGWVRDGKPVYAFEGIINFTGATIVWLRDQLQLIQSVQETEALAQGVDDNGGVYLIPAFVGLGAPYWRSAAKAAIVGLTPFSTKNHIVRAALESIAYQVKDVLLLMGDDAGVSLQQVHADGGAVNNLFLMQFTADLTGLTVKASTLPELSALGAVLSGLLGMGVYQSLDELAQMPQEFSSYYPAMDIALVEQNYAGWKAAVEKV